jgi:hypothetical protein
LEEGRIPGLIVLGQSVRLRRDGRVGRILESVDEGTLRRIERAAGVEDLAGVLERLAPTDLQSLLLEVYRRRARGLTPKAVLDQYERNRFVTPAAAAADRLLELDRRAYSLLPDGYEPVELAPVAPLGASSVLGAVSQDWAVATARNTEVVSDSTNVLALEAALRRRRDRATPVKLAASHRLLRVQDYAGSAAQHFRLLALVAAGRGPEFEVASVVEQLEFFRRLLGEVRIALTPLASGLAESVRERLDSPVELDPSRESGRAYYVGLCFKIHAGDVELVDGGFTGWTQALLGDRKERLLISGLGTERALPAERPDEASVQMRRRRT